MAKAIFTRDGERYVPTDLARGPWTPEAQHGGAPSALLAAIVAGYEGGEAMFVSRLTIELLRPVPIAPLGVRARMLRPGRKVQLVEASLFNGDTDVARCTALRIRRAALTIPAALLRSTTPPGPETGVNGMPPWANAGYLAFHNGGVEHRFVAGSFERPGPATDWIRLRVPLIEGEDTPPLSRVAAAADFGNGISWIVNRSDGFTFINPDLTIYVHRYPAGEWVCLDAVTTVQPHGVGLSQSALFDEQGSIGRSAQSLLIEQSS